MLPLVHLYVSKVPRTRQRVVRILLLYALVLGVGAIGLPLGFVPNVFFADATARAIGWTTGSPFPFEVGMHDGAWGVVGFLGIGIGGRFWLATGLGWSLFMLGATYGHIRHTVLEGDYAPYNFLTIFSDAFIAIWLLVLPWLYWRSGGARVGRDRLPRGPRSPIYSPREVGSRRVPRQPGQVRKEAALTSVSRVARPASHLP